MEIELVYLGRKTGDKGSFVFKLFDLRRGEPAGECFLEIAEDLSRAWIVPKY